MRLRTLGWLLLGYGVLLLVACLLLYRVAALHPTPHGEVIASLWQAGELAQRVVRASPGARDDRIDRALAQGAGELVLETVVQEGGILCHVAGAGEGRAARHPGRQNRLCHA
jgi:hypothetical protein